MPGCFVRPQGSAIEDVSHKPGPKYDEVGKFDEEPDIDVTVVSGIISL